ncbi:TolC family protein [bacterium]|nr:TolC family protein [bacterium]
MKKLFKNILILLFVICLLQVKAYAITDDENKFISVDLKTAISIAENKNIDYIAAKKNLEIAQQKIKAAGRFQNPSVSTLVNMGRAGQESTDNITLNETIEVAKRGPRIAIAKAQYELTQQEIDYLKFQLNINVRKAYTELLIAKHIYTSLLKYEELLSDLYKTAKEEFAAKRLSKLDFLQIEVAFNRIIPDINQARVDVELKREAFNNIINSDEDEIYDVSISQLSQNNDFEELLVPNPDINLSDIEEYIKFGLENRFDIKQAKQKVFIAEKKLISVNRQRIPDIQLFGGYQYMRKNMNPDKEYLPGAFVGTALNNIPIFYTFKPEIKAAQTELEQAKLEYESVVNKAKKDIISNYKQFKIAKINLNYYKQKLTLSTDMLTSTAKDVYMKNGRKDILAMIALEQSCREITKSYTDTLTTYYNSWINLLESVQNENYSEAL